MRVHDPALGRSAPLSERQRLSLRAQNQTRYMVAH